MTKDTFEKTMNSIYKWSIKDGKIDPPKSELPECIKERVRWLLSLANNDYIPGISFLGQIESVLPDPDEEEKHKKDWESGSFTDWLPLSDEYKQYYQDNRAYFSFTIPAAVAIELLFGLNEDDNSKQNARGDIDMELIAKIAEMAILINNVGFPVEIKGKNYMTACCKEKMTSQLMLFLIEKLNLDSNQELNKIADKIYKIAYDGFATKEEDLKMLKENIQLFSNDDVQSELDNSKQLIDFYDKL